MNNIALNITVKLNKQFATEFIAMLERMVYNGRVGHSEWVAFYSDGDGAFRPEITIDGLDNDLLYNQLSQRDNEKHIHATCFDAT